MLPKLISQKFTVNTRHALENAFVMAHKLKAREIMAEHLFLGIWQERGSLGMALLQLHEFKLKKSPPSINLNPQQSHLQKTKRINMDIPLSEQVKKILKKAALIANRHFHKYIGTEHILYSVLDTKNEEVDKILKNANVSKKQIKKSLLGILKNTGIFPDPINIFRTMPKEPGQQNQKRLQKSILSYFCANLTELARENKLDPVIGRDHEIERLIHIISRKGKNSPILIGEPGVGKTAIVHGLATKIAKGEVPENLKNKQILSLDLSLVMAGTMLRGDLEAKLKDIIEETKEIGNIVLFIDEIHNIISAGNAAGSMDAANILKPALSQNEIQCIGATTLDEYRRTIERDRALERRLQPILVKELSAEHTVKILTELKPAYEHYHRVKISDESIKSAVQLSEQYLTQRYLPDKAIDIIDETSARVRSKTKSQTVFSKKIEALKNRLQKIMKEKEVSILKEDYQNAIGLQNKEEEITRRLMNYEEKLKQQQNVPTLEIFEKDVQETITNITGIPLAQLKTGQVNVNKLEKIINKKIVGQKEAITEVCGFIKRARAGLASPKRPLGSFLFLGPSGVGKTEFAKVLAKELFGNKESFVRLDMSEFMEKHNVSRLIGAPPGYIGYEEGGKLTEHIKKVPYSLILLDEIEKAHPDVFNILLQILDDGILTDARGTEVNFKNTIIIMTSNIGTGDFSQEAYKLGFTVNKKVNCKKESMLEKRYREIQSKALTDLKSYMKPELINRIGRILVFKPLNIKDIEKIIDLEISDLESRLRNQNIKIITNPEARKKLAEKSFNPREGARLVRRQVQKMIEDPIASIILRSKESDNDDSKKITHIEIIYKNNGLTLKPRRVQNN